MTSIIIHYAVPKKQRTVYQSKVNSITIIILSLVGLVSAFATSYNSERGLFLPTRCARKTCLNKTFFISGTVSTIKDGACATVDTIKNINSQNTALFNRGGGGDDDDDNDGNDGNDDNDDNDGNDNDSEDMKMDGKGFVQILKEIPVNPSYELPGDNYNKRMPICKRGIILVDSFCPFHGRYLDRIAREAYGAGVVNVLSDYLTGYLYFERGITDHISTRAPRGTQDVKDWVRKIPFDIVGIICESDSGLGDAEKLGVHLGLFPYRHDGFNEARRDKFLMNKCISEHGMRVCRQRLCSSVEDAVKFASELGVVDQHYYEEEDHKTTKISRTSMDIFKSGALGKASNMPAKLSPIGKYCIVKPCRGVASDGVHFCPHIDAVRRAFERVHDSSVFGSTTAGEKNEAVLVQEFAAGTEYVLDIVSKAGEHKCAALWRYDKRSVNGSPFVYFATEVIDAHTPMGKVICEYAMKSLDALGVRWGMSHNEFIVDEDGPRLVEVNCRQHNTDFAPLTTACMGYNALDMLLSAYLGDESDLPLDTAHMRLVWDELPIVPVSRAFGAVVHLVCHVEGIITDIHEEVIEEIGNLPSVVAMEVYPEFSVGSEVEKTINIKSDSGWVHLISDDEEQFQQDYNRIVDLMPLMFSV